MVAVVFVVIIIIGCDLKDSSIDGANETPRGAFGENTVPHLFHAFLLRSQIRNSLFVTVFVWFCALKLCA